MQEITSPKSKAGKKDENALKFLLKSIIRSNSDIERIFLTRLDGMTLTAAGRKGDKHFPDKDLIAAQIAAISNTTSQNWYTIFAEGGGGGAKRVIIDGDDGTLFILRFRDMTEQSYVTMFQVKTDHDVQRFLSSLEMLDKYFSTTDLSKFTDF